MWPSATTDLTGNAFAHIRGSRWLVLARLAGREDCHQIVEACQRRLVGTHEIYTKQATHVGIVGTVRGLVKDLATLDV